MRLLTLFLIAAATFAQIPSDTVVGTLSQRATARRAFLAAHPNAQEILRREGAIHFEVGGLRTAILQPGAAYVDPDSGEITPTDLDLVQTQAGYRTVGSPVVVRVVEGPLVGGNPTSMVQTFRKDPVDKTVTGYAVVTAPLTYQSGFRFTFQQQGVSWSLELLEFGWDLRAAVPVSQGSKTYRFGYDEVKMSLDPDADGNLSIPSGRYKITRPAMLRADGIETPCSSWLVDRAGVRIGFTCDDTGFPAEAYPYVIDPTGTYSIAVSTDDGHLYRPGAATWPVNSGTIYAYTNDTVTRASDSYATTYSTTFTLFRWDTSAITTGNVVHSATLSLTTAAGYGNPNGCGVYFDWVSAAIFPVGTEDWVATSSYTGNARSGDLADAFPVTDQTYVLPLSNVSNVNRSGYTALRLGVRCSSQPNGNNYNRFYSFDYGNPAYRPTLTVVYGNRAPATVSATPGSGSIAAGAATTFTFQVSDPDGYADISWYHLQLSAGPVGTPGVWDANSCFLYILPSANVLYLRKDDGTEPWLGGYTFGSANFVENSQCRIDYANSTLTNSGTTSTAAVRMQLKATFSAGGWTKHTYVWVIDAANLTDGWDDYGSWTLVPGGPKLIIVQQ